MFESLHEAGLATPLDRVKRIVVFVVNSLSSPANDWNEREQPPGPIPVMVKAAGVPIDRYSGESVELLKDIATRWRTLRQLRDSAAFTNREASRGEVCRARAERRPLRDRGLVPGAKGRR